MTNPFFVIATLVIRIIDCTLRDGEQAPGVVFNYREKVTIAKLLDRLGVCQIEAGIPVMGEVEQVAIKAIAGMGLTSRVSTWNRLLLADIRASLDCGVRDLHISAPVSDLHIRYKLGKSHQWVLDCLKRALRYAKDYGCRVTVGAEDAFRADESFLCEFALLAREMGAERLRYCDTVGIMTPFALSRVMDRLKEKLEIELEFHGHNDFGLATANSLTAVKAGVRYIDTTIGGLGERAGNACLEELALALKGTCAIDLDLNPRVLRALGHYVARGANRPVTHAG